MAELSSRDRTLFRTEVRYWAHQYFHLHEWELRFSEEEDDECLASVRWNRGQGVAVFTLTVTWEQDPITDDNISRVAFHEVCELLLGALNDMGSATFQDGEVEREVHRVVRRLENTVFEDEWARRLSQGL